MTRLTQQIVWIPVEEKLPEIGEEVMVALGFGKMWTARRHEDGIYRDGAIIAIKPEAITHWAYPFKHPRELQAEIDTKRAAEQEDFKKVGRRCIECDAPISECECN